MIKPKLENYHGSLKIREENGIRQIYDPVRKKYFVIQPEELVRQSWIECLAREFDWPLSNVSVEKTLVINHLKRRFDMVLYRKAIPHILFELKSFNIPLNQDIAHQAAMYNLVLKVPYIIISNGMEHHAFKLDHSRGISELCASLDFLRYRN